MSYPPQQPYGQQPYGQPPFGGHSGAGQVPPDNFLVWSIVSLVASFFCCQLSLIPSVVAVVFSSQVEGKFYAGDYYGAENAAKNARTWTIVSFALSALGFVAIIAYFVFVLFYIGSVEPTGTTY